MWTPRLKQTLDAAQEQRRRVRPEERLKPARERYSAAQVADALSSAAGNITHAAKLLGLQRDALRRLMKIYGIKADR